MIGQEHLDPLLSRTIVLPRCNLKMKSKLKIMKKASTSRVMLLRDLINLKRIL
jgi:hypothetical protein